MIMPKFNSFWNPPTIVVMGLLVFSVFWLNLWLPALSALTMFSLIVSANDLISKKFQLSKNVNLFISVFLCVILAVGALVGSFFVLLSMFDNNTGAVALMSQISEALLLIRANAPDWLTKYIPLDANSLVKSLEIWASEHASEIPLFGKKVITISFHIILGSFIGIMVAMHSIKGAFSLGCKDDLDFNNGFIKETSWHNKMMGHTKRFAISFRQVVFAQFYIALLNAVLTGVFLALILPALGHQIPLTKTLIFLTFFAGLIPILGNILSNTIIFLVALLVSPLTAFLCLSYLIIIHKLEYFLNAMIIGSKIKVKSYEILCAMIFFEAIFGIWGVILSPIIYSYFKEELKFTQINKITDQA